MNAEYVGNGPGFWYRKRSGFCPFVVRVLTNHILAGFACMQVNNFRTHRISSEDNETFNLLLLALSVYRDQPRCRLAQRY